MKEIKKSEIWSLAIIIIILLLAFGIIYFPKNTVTPEKETAICIGENAIFYTQIGCHYCGIQEEMFGENSQYLDIFLCNNNWTKCREAEIRGTPSWEINGKLYSGVQSIEKLKTLTNC